MARTTAFRSALQDALPERTFRVVLRDGSEIPPTSPDGGPTLTARSAQALAHVLRAPGELGLGCGCGTGALDVDDLDSVIGLLDTWKPPPLDNRVKAKLALGA